MGTAAKVDSASELLQTETLKEDIETFKSVLSQQQEFEQALLQRKKELEEALAELYQTAELVDKAREISKTEQKLIKRKEGLENACSELTKCLQEFKGLEKQERVSTAGGPPNDHFLEVARSVVGNYQNNIKLKEILALYQNAKQQAER